MLINYSACMIFILKTRDIRRIRWLFQKPMDELSPFSLALGIVISPYLKYVYQILVGIGVLVLFYLVFGTFYYGDQQPRSQYLPAEATLLPPPKYEHVSKDAKYKRKNLSLLRIDTGIPSLSVCRRSSTYCIPQQLESLLSQSLKDLFQTSVLTPMKSRMKGFPDMEASLTALIEPKLGELAAFLAGMRTTNLIYTPSLMPTLHRGFHMNQTSFEPLIGSCLQSCSLKRQ